VDVPLLTKDRRMRLVTFEDSARRSHIGAKVSEEQIVDLTSACALYLRDVEKNRSFQRVADSHAPADMRRFLEGGDKSLGLARKALAYIQQRRAPDVAEESLVFSISQVKIKAPIIPKKFFHTAGNFREHHVEAEKAGFSHPVLPWIVFFQNVDAIIGPDEPVVYPSHLTRELDYELELAVVLKKSGKHFSAQEAADYIGGYMIFNDITARDIQRTEM